MKYLLVFVCGIVCGVIVWIYASIRAMDEYQKGLNNFLRAYNGSPKR